MPVASAQGASVRTIWEGKIIRSIETVPAERSNLIDQKRYTHYRAEAIRAALSEWYQTGAFRDIRVEAVPFGTEEISLKFIFVQRQHLADLILSGTHRLSAEEVRPALGLKIGEEWTPSRWKTAQTAAQRFLQDRGYFQASLHPHVTSFDQDRRIALHVHLKERNRARIRSVAFPGDPLFSKTRLMLRLRSHPGAYYQRALLMQDVERLRSFYHSKGYLTVTIPPPKLYWDERTNEVDLQWEIFPRHRIDLFFDTPGKISTDRLLSLVRITEEGSDENQVLEASAEAMVALYRSEGYPFAAVTYTAQHIRSEHRSEVRFIIETGPRTKIRAVFFLGHPTVSKAQLQRKVQLTPRRSKVAPWFGKTTVYTEAQRLADTQALLNFYREMGYRRARVRSRAQFNDSKTEVSLYFHIREGVQTHITKLRVTGDDALSEIELLPTFLMRLPYHEARLQEGLRHIQSLYADHGYIYATVFAEPHFSEDQAEIVYTVHEGHQARLGQFTLIGNKHTRASVLLRELQLRSGDLYRPALILESQRRLYRTGYFSSVRFVPQEIDTQPHVIDLHLSVVERPYLPVDFGMGYGEHERLRGFFEIAHLNLLGYGPEVRLRASASSLEEEYLLSFREPWLFSKNLNFRASLSQSKQKKSAYDLASIGATAGVEYHFSDILTGLLQYQFERHHIEAEDPKIALSPADAGKLNIATINASLVLDTRDDLFNPTQGTLSGVTLRNGAKLIGSEVQMVKLTLQHSVYRAFGRLGDRPLVWAFGGKMGIAERFGKTGLIPPPERFLLGGRNTVRGYKSNTLGIPKQTLTLENTPLGGNAFVALNEELRISFSSTFGGVVFLDHGNVWAETSSIQLSEIQSTTGIGLRYHTPIGPIRLDWGYKLDRPDHTARSELHFAIGHMF